MFLARFVKIGKLILDKNQNTCMWKYYGRNDRDGHYDNIPFTPSTRAIYANFKSNICTLSNRI